MFAAKEDSHVTDGRRSVTLEEKGDPPIARHPFDRIKTSFRKTPLDIAKTLLRTFVKAPILSYC